MAGSLGAARPPRAAPQGTQTPLRRLDTRRCVPPDSDERFPGDWPSRPGFYTPRAGLGLQDFAGTDGSINSETGGGPSHPQSHLPFGTLRTRRREVRGRVLGSGRGL